MSAQLQDFKDQSNLGAQDRGLEALWGVCNYTEKC